MHKTIFVPVIGSELVLAQRWPFQLYNARTNKKLMRLLGDHRTEDKRPTPAPNSLPAGSVLRVGSMLNENRPARVVTVSLYLDRLGYSTDPQVRSTLFWAAMQDFNTMVVEEPKAEPQQPCVVCAGCAHFVPEAVGDTRHPHQCDNYGHPKCPLPIPR